VWATIISKDLVAAWPPPSAASSDSKLEKLHKMSYLELTQIEKYYDSFHASDPAGSRPKAKLLRDIAELVSTDPDNDRHVEGEVNQDQCPRCIQKFQVASDKKKRKRHDDRTDSLP